jgi:SAM-dependent methyltransferase
MKPITCMLFDFHNDCIDLNGNIIFTKIASREALSEYRDSVIKPRLEFEEEIAELVRNSSDQTFLLSGFSETAGTFTKFRLDFAYSDGKMPNFRERLVCAETNLNNRQRFVCRYIQKLIDRQGYVSLFTFEQATPVYRFLSHNTNNANITGSEYFSPDYGRGQIINGIRHEDALNLSFNDESFDIVFSWEILHRTPDLYKAVRETYRIMKSGGTFLFSTPFNNNITRSHQHARLTAAGIEHSGGITYYHGHHQVEKKSPVFYELGWDLLDIIKECGFKNVYLLCYYSATYGYMGDGLQSIFVAEK